MTAGSVRADSIIRRLGFPRSFRVEAVGFAGGIWVRWKNFVTLAVSYFNDQLVHMRISLPPDFFLSAVYADPDRVHQRFLWSSIKYINNNLTGEWCLLGDFHVGGG